MKSVVVTGASSGIGRVTALRMDALGWQVFAGIRREEDGRALQATSSSRLTPVQLDVTVPDQIGAAAERIENEVGEAGLDGLVNNAGITIPCPLEAMPIDDFRRLFEVNVIGQIAITQAMLPQLRSAPGRVVFVSSVSALRGAPLLSGYSASKAGLEAVGDALRLELHRQGVAVSIIEPGSVETRIWEQGEEEIEVIQKRVSTELHGLYDRTIAGFRRVVDQGASRRVSPEKVAESIEHALIARRPRVRYRVGTDARAQALALRLLPDRVLDFATARLLRL